MHVTRDNDQVGKQRLWQTCDPIGKLHYIVVYILRIPQRRSVYKAGDKDLGATEYILKRDNSTRWNSIYQMILRACELRTWVELYCFKAQTFLSRD
jgi:hypothetical protein